jgi:hypothetical protein
MWNSCGSSVVYPVIAQSRCLILGRRHIATSAPLTVGLRGGGVRTLMQVNALYPERLSDTSQSVQIRRRIVVAFRLSAPVKHVMRLLTLLRRVRVLEPMFLQSEPAREALVAHKSAQPLSLISVTRLR